MKSVRWVVLALITSILTIGAPVAYADSKPTPTAKAKAENSGLQNKQAIEKFHDQMYLREAHRNQITQAFMKEVMRANKSTKIALRVATTVDAKAEIVAKHKTAISLAVTTRDNAILAMGPEPIKPIKPSKSQLLAPKAKSGTPSPSP